MAPHFMDGRSQPSAVLKEASDHAFVRQALHCVISCIQIGTLLSRSCLANQPSLVLCNLGRQPICRQPLSLCIRPVCSCLWNGI